MTKLHITAAATEVMPSSAMQTSHLQPLRAQAMMTDKTSMTFAVLCFAVKIAWPSSPLPDFSLRSVLSAPLTKHYSLSD
jgi:hypothetical protein